MTIKCKMALSSDNIKFENTNVIINVSDKKYISTTYMTSIIPKKSISSNNYSNYTMYIIINYKPIYIYKHKTDVLELIDNYVNVVKRNSYSLISESYSIIDYHTNFELTYKRASNVESPKEITQIASKMDNNKDYFVLCLKVKCAGRIGFTIVHDFPNYCRYVVPGILVKDSKIIKRDAFVIMCNPFIEKINTNYDSIKQSYLRFTNQSKLLKLKRNIYNFIYFTNKHRSMRILEDKTSYVAISEGKIVILIFKFKLDPSYSGIKIKDTSILNGIAILFPKHATYPKECNTMWTIPLKLLPK